MIISSFLGNFGKKYELTRHNLAWMVLEKLSFYQQLRWDKKFKGEYAKSMNPEMILLKPMTLMNKSGESVAAALSFYKAGSEDLIVIHDDLELPFGTVQIKKGGGAGGHNGLRSIISLTGGSSFFRFRLGISRPPAGRDVSSWVLNRFSSEEEAWLPEYCSRAADLLQKTCEQPLSAGDRIKLINY